MKKVIDYIINPYKILLFLDNRTFLKLKDELYLKWMFKKYLNLELDLKNPLRFNEKLQWLKINDRNALYTTLVDKYAVKTYIKNRIGAEYIIPTINVYEKFEDIDFESLPNKFVIKCTHDSGGNIICKDKSKLDIKKAKKKINDCLKRNYFKFGREWPYKDVDKKIIIEEYMEDSKTKELRDYKFFCFNGEVKFFKIDFDRFINHRANYYNIKKELLYFGEADYLPDYNKNIEFPENIDKMIELANVLTADIPFVRVDFYDVDGKIYFGEMTFFPASGFGRFEPDEWDEKIGNMLDLPIK